VSQLDVMHDYQQAAEKARRDRLIVDHLTLVRHVLGRLIGELPPGLDFENLEAAGVLGLVEAAARFDPTRDAQFPTFAYWRIRGAIVDELRRNSVFPQQVMDRIGRVQAARRELAAPVTVEALARQTGLSESDVAQTLQAMRLARPAPCDGRTPVPDHRDSPVKQAEDAEALQRLTAAIEALPERTRLVLTLYYREDLRLKEIAELTGLSVSRLSRLLDATVFELREKLSEHHGGR
jgi:RNA polymerase sigma factor for flagellar operon FliA